MKKTFRKLISTYLVIFLPCIAFSAHPETDNKYQEDKLQFHAIQSDLIKDIMHRINSSYYEAAPDEFESDENLQENITHLIININELMIATLYLNRAMPAFDLTDEEKQIFQSVAAQLNQEAISLRQATEKRDYHKMNVSYQRLTDTCAACHELFRF